MISAFGVDHGEISKIAARAPKPGLLKRVIRGSAPRDHRGKKLNAQQIRTQTTSVGPTPTQKIKAKAHQAGEADISLKGIGRFAGKGVKGVSDFVQTHPGTTGTALVGGAGAGTYGYVQSQKKKS